MPGKNPASAIAEQDAHRVEAPLSDDEHHRHRDEAPDDHDSGDPDASADSLQDQIARYLEQAVAQKEEAAAQPVGGVAQAQIPLKFGRSEPDVDPVDVRDHVAEEHERDQAADDAGNRGALLVGGKLSHG